LGGGGDFVKLNLYLRKSDLHLPKPINGSKTEIPVTASGDILNENRRCADGKEAAGPQGDLIVWFCRRGTVWLRNSSAVLLHAFVQSEWSVLATAVCYEKLYFDLSFVNAGS
jgi:hypothetical protein